MAIRSCFVDTLVGLKVPPMFPKNVSYNEVPPSLDWVHSSSVPQRQRYYEALRLLTVNV